MHSIFTSTLTRLFTFAFVALSLTASICTAADDTYLIQPGDVLDISVWNEETLSRPVIVRPDGGMSFPLAGDLKAAGESVESLGETITERLSKYIPDPVVTVSMQQLSGNKIYVVGKVARPGEYVANSYVDVVQAIAMAGGMTPFAAVNKIQIVRRDGEKLEAYPFRFSDIEKGENLEQNIVLESGDIVVVP
jgi:polysaccharide export outer membrane protein